MLFCVFYQICLYFVCICFACICFACICFAFVLFWLVVVLAGCFCLCLFLGFFISKYHQTSNFDHRLDSCRLKPLQIWGQSVQNGHIKQATHHCDDDDNNKGCDYDDGDCWCPQTVKGGKVQKLYSTRYVAKVFHSHCISISHLPGCV